MQDKRDKQKDEIDERPTRGSRKDVMREIQELTLEITQLNDHDFNRLDPEPELREEMVLFRKIASNHAKRRQLRYLSGIVASCDMEALRKKLKQIRRKG